jgi:hypothetical protein
MTPELISEPEETPESVISTQTVTEATTDMEASTTNESDSTIMKWLPVIIAAVIVVLGAILIPVLIRRRHG